MKSNGRDLSELSKKFAPARETGAEETRELDGFDADMDEATMGDAGNGAAPYGADTSGGLPKPFEDAAEGGDISPDQVRHLMRVAGDEDEDRELTAKPADRVPVDASDPE